MRYATKLATTVTLLLAIGMTVAVAYVEKNQVFNIKATFNQLTPAVQKEVTCLADNVLFEAGFEPEEGQIAVALVTMNRVRSGKYADSVCGVVKQKTGATCQFSWWCEDKPRNASITRKLTNAQQEVYNSIRDLAMFVYLNDDKVKDITHGATYYHADYVNPGWRHLKKTVKIGRHIFYTRGEVDNYDEQTESGAKAGQANTLIFSPNGGNHDGYLQSSYRMGF
jgi:spore germination cell wall hydrolase CwlJ-like protein